MFKSSPLLNKASEVRGRSLWQDAFARLTANPAALLSLLVLAALTTLTIIGPMASAFAVDDLDWNAIWQVPSFRGDHPFGTDSLGRDLFVRVLEGGRISLLIGVVSTLVSLLVGVSYGAIAGYFGGKVDTVMMRVVDILYALPFLFFVILLMVFFGRHLVLIFVAIGFVNWLDMARIVRGQTLSLKHKEFIEAARMAGAPNARIIRHHIVPNLLGVVVVYATLTIPHVILVESFLSFLGLGVQEPATSWGALVSDAVPEMQRAPWLLVYPASFLAVTLLCFNFIGDGLRDALDPKDR